QHPEQVLLELLVGRYLRPEVARKQGLVRLGSYPRSVLPTLAIGRRAGGERSSSRITSSLGSSCSWFVLLRRNIELSGLHKLVCGWAAGFRSIGWVGPRWSWRNGAGRAA